MGIPSPRAKGCVSVPRQYARFCRPVPARRAVERLILLDAVLADADLNWLTSDAEKVAYVAALTASKPAAELHAAAHDVSPRRPVKTFPGTFPIEVDPGGR